MSNLSSAVYTVNRGRGNSSRALDLRWTREISRRLGIKRKGTVGVKFYTTNAGAHRVAVRAKANPVKGFRALKLRGAGTLCDSVRFGIGNVLDCNPSASSIYKFTGKTMYINIPFVSNADGVAAI